MLPYSPYPPYPPYAPVVLPPSPAELERRALRREGHFLGTGMLLLIFLQQIIASVVLWLLSLFGLTDLSAIAKGYAVDAVSEALTAIGFGHHLVEIGGEPYGARQIGGPGAELAAPDRIVEQRRRAMTDVERGHAGVHGSSSGRHSA